MLRQYGYLKGRGERTRRPFPYIVAVNGEYVLQKTWTRRIKSGDTVAVIHQPEGGGGSNPLRIVAMIAILVLSVYTGGAVAGVYGATAGALASAAISIAGSMLLNMLFPVKPQSLSLGDSTSASPSYSIAGSQNSVRLGQAIPVVYGRMRVVPDYASRPYTEYQGDEQYLYQLHAISKGQVEIEQIRVDDADVSSYGEVQYEVIPPGSPVTLFPDNVTTSPAVDNLELVAPDQPGYAVLGPFPT
ncbi:MoaD/ThiS family protein, partial [Staphylococcus aureus]|uniref:MoaD/ThiS family protein n=1 Tax=Staphylococcus aureus TaxID=1280 RepID=UPI001C2E629A